MAMRGTTAPVDASGNYTFYCRACGLVMKAKDMPGLCTWCGNDLIDKGFGISGDNGLSETSTSANYPSRGQVIVDVDKPLRY